MPSKRRKFISTLTGGTIVGLAGCSGGEQEEPETNGPEGTTVSADKPGPESDKEYDQVREMETPGPNREQYPLNHQAARLITNWWGELGLRTNFTPTDIGALIDLKDSGEGDIVFMSWGASPSRLDPVILLEAPFHSEGSENFSHYSNPEYDKTVKEFVRNPNQDERQSLAQKCQRILAADQPSSFMWHKDALAAVDENQFTDWKGQAGVTTFWNPYSLSRLQSKGTDTVIMGSPQSINRLHPMTGGTEWNQYGRQMIYSRLTRINADNKFVPSAASEIAPRDETTIDVTIREGIKFHDSEDLTADDVKFTIEYLQEYDFPDQLTYYKPIERVEKLGKYKVRISITEPIASFGTVYLAQFNILPKHIWEGVVEEKGLDHPKQWSDFDMTGSGPFKVESWDPGNRLVLSAVDNHPNWDFDFNRLAYRQYGSISSAMGDLESGKLTMIQGLGPTSFQKAKDSSTITGENVPSHGFVFAIHQAKDKPPLNDVVFRRALTHAMDKQELVGGILDGYGKPASSSVAPANKFFHADDTKKYKGGIKRAVELLRDAGYRWNDNGNLLMPRNRFEGDGPPVLASDLPDFNGY